MSAAAGISDFAKDTILSLLQEFFSNERNVGPDLLYHGDPAQSRVLIADKYTLNLEEVEKKPAIVVIRGAQSWGRRGLDQFKGWTGPNTAEEFTDLVQGTMSCTCLSTEGLEAERIAWIVFAFFQMFRRRIRETVMGVHDILAGALGEELAAQTDSKVDVSVVPVSLVMVFQWKWTLEQMGPALRDVDVKVRHRNAETVTKFIERAVPAKLI